MHVGVVGAGTISRERHLPVLQRSDLVSEISVSDRNPGRARRAARSVDGSAVSPSDVPTTADLVLVATPPWAHAEYVVDALAAETPVLTEKPLAVDPSEVARMRAAEEESDAWVSVIHNFLYQRSVRSAIERIKGGSIGSLNRVYALQLSDPSWNVNLHGEEWFDRLPGGMFWDECPHMVYLVDRFAGELPRPSVTVDDRAVRTQPLREVSARFDSTISSRITMVFDAPLTEWWLILLGDDGIVAVDIFRNVCIALDRAPVNDARGVFAPLAQAGAHVSTGVLRSCVEYFRDQILGTQSAPRAGFDVQLRETIEAVRRGTGPPVTLDDGERVYEQMWNIADRGGFSPASWPHRTEVKRR